jgi:hypothetical protein
MTFAPISTRSSGILEGDFRGFPSRKWRYSALKSAIAPFSYGLPNHIFIRRYTSCAADRTSLDHKRNGSHQVVLSRTQSGHFRTKHRVNLHWHGHWEIENSDRSWSIVGRWRWTANRPELGTALFVSSVVLIWCYFSVLSTWTCTCLALDTKSSTHKYKKEVQVDNISIT